MRDACPLLGMSPASTRATSVSQGRTAINHSHPLCTKREEHHGLARVERPGSSSTPHHGSTNVH